VPLVIQVSRFIFRILKSFGIYEEGDFPEVTGLDTEGGAEGSKGQSFEDVITPLMNIITKYRQEVNKLAGGDAKEIFKLSDDLRDEILPHLGICIEDKGKLDSVWKYEADVSKLLKDLQDKKDSKAAEAEKKAYDKLERER
jgi:hypothetical protein